MCGYRDACFFTDAFAPGCIADIVHEIVSGAARSADVQMISASGPAKMNARISYVLQRILDRRREAGVEPLPPSAVALMDEIADDLPVRLSSTTSLSRVAPLQALRANGDADPAQCRGCV